MASDSGVPRFQILRIRGYPDVVMDPGPKSVPTRSVLESYQATRLLASGRKNPPSTKDLLT